VLDGKPGGPAVRRCSNRCSRALNFRYADSGPGREHALSADARRSQRIRTLWKEGNIDEAELAFRLALDIWQGEAAAASGAGWILTVALPLKAAGVAEAERGQGGT